jgi:hypothetical protein
MIPSVQVIVECAGAQGLIAVPDLPKRTRETALAVDSIANTTRPAAWAQRVRLKRLPDLSPAMLLYMGVDPDGRDVVVAAGRKFQRHLIEVVHSAYPNAEWFAGGSTYDRNVVAVAKVDGRIVGVVAGLKS